MALEKIKKVIFGHKIIVLLVILALAGGGYYVYYYFSKTEGQTKYVLTQVKKGTLVVSVAASGQISATDQYDVKPDVAGELTEVNVENGQKVKKDDVLIVIDDSEAQKLVSEAEIALETAQLSLEKLQEPASGVALLQAENALAQSKEAKAKAEEAIPESYQNGYDAVAGVFADLPDAVSDLKGILYDNTLDSSQDNIDWYADQIDSWKKTAVSGYKISLEKNYKSAIKKYNANFANYLAASRSSDQATIVSLLEETAATAQSLGNLAVEISNYISYVTGVMRDHSVSVPAAVGEQKTALGMISTKVSSGQKNISAAEEAISSAKNNLTSAEISYQEKTESYNNLIAGADDLELRSQELSVSQKEDALASAKEKLADYVIAAPFDGSISGLNAEVGDTVSQTAALLTLLSEQQIAEVSLNEVDVADIKTGQKATLTFDAVSDLSITGSVIDVDSSGAVSQGVVSYSATISLDSQDERIKSGMSVSAAIITDIESDVLVVPNGAIKASGDNSVVLVPSGTAPANINSTGGVELDTVPTQKIVETGVSNDSYTQITSGVSEGDWVVSRTITSTNTNSSSQSSSSQSKSLFQSTTTGMPNDGPAMGSFGR